MRKYYAYIDESGDEGINRGSKYFVITAVIIRDIDVTRVKSKMRYIKDKYNTKFLHWNTIRGLNVKKDILSLISEEDFTIINLVVDTTKLTVIKSNRMYNYYSGFLLERISWYVKSCNAKCNVLVSSRCNMSEYIKYIRSSNAKHNIDGVVINKIEVIDNKRSDLLQLADICASSLNQSLKKKYNFKCYLENKYYQYNNKVEGYGIKYIP